MRSAGRDIVAVVVCAVLLWISAIMIVIPRSEATYVAHSPILIDSDVIDDDDGVTGGSGTELDPYVIEGWQIDHFDESSIDIKDCDAHYLIRNVYVRISPDYQYLSHYGIHVENSSNVTIEDCLIVDNYSGGVMVYGSRSIRIIDNQLSGNTIYLGMCRDVLVDGNQLSSTSIRLYASVSVNLGNNTIDSGGIYIDGYSADDFSTHTIATTNTVSGGPVLYFKNRDSVTIDQNMTGGEVIIANCSGVHIANLNMTNMSGLFVSYCDEVTVSNVQAYQNHPGLVLSHASHVTIDNCSLTQTTWDKDLKLYLPAALSLQDVTNTDIINCATLENFGGTRLEMDGIGLRQSTNVTVIGCDLSGYSGISCYSSTDSTIRGNGFGRCMEDAVSLYECAGFEIFQNNIGLNSFRSWPYSDAYNSWDGGYPDGGNYWGYYSGYDNFSGPDQDAPGLDGIGDVPFGLDRYPLMEPYTYPHPRAVFSIAPVENLTRVFLVNASGCWDPNDPVSLLEVRWDWEDDGVWDTFWSTDKTEQHQYTEGGEYTIRLEVMDTGFLTSNATKQIIVDDTPPIADAGPDQTVDEDTLVYFDGSGSSDNVDVFNYTWTFADGTEKTLYEVDPTHTFEIPGIYTVTLNVTDATSNWSTDKVTITVNDATIPSANAGLDQTVDEDSLVTFDGSGSSDNVDIVNYTWTFTYDGDTVDLYGETPTFKFDRAGVYAVTLTVKDNAGLTETDVVEITVEEKAGISMLAVGAIGIIIVAIVALAVFIMIRKKKPPHET